MTRPTSRRLLIVALLGLALGASRPATAGLMGSTVNVSAYFPDTTTVYANPGDATVTSGVEYSVGSFDPGYPFQVDVTDDQIILSNPLSSGGEFNPALFNGFILKVISGPAILTASLSGSSDFSPASITLLNGNEVQLNYAGVNIGNNPAPQSVIVFTFAPNAVPEPSSLISGGIAGVLGLACIRRRKAKAGA